METGKKQGKNNYLISLCKAEIKVYEGSMGRFL